MVLFALSMQCASPGFYPAATVEGPAVLKYILPYALVIPVQHEKSEHCHDSPFALLHANF